MLQILIWGFIAYWGASAHRLRWKPFGILAIAAALLTFVTSFMRARRQTIFDRDYSDLLNPDILAINTAATLGIYSTVYLVGYAFGWWRRKRAADHD